LFLLPVPLPRACQDIVTLKTLGNQFPSNLLPVRAVIPCLAFNKGDPEMNNPNDKPGHEKPGQQTQNPGQQNPGQKPGQQQGGGHKPGQQQQDPGKGR
jgi:hypothetical protein